MNFKLIIIISIMLISLNGIFACNITPISGITCQPCNSTTKICECNFGNIVIVENTDKLFTSSTCSGYTINVNTNGKNIWLKNNLNMGDLNWNLVMSQTSRIIIENSSSRDINLSNVIILPGSDISTLMNDFQQRTDVKILFKATNIKVHPNSILDLNLSSNDGISHGTSNNCNRPSHDAGTKSGNIILDVNHIENNGRTTIYLKTGNGGKGNSMRKEDCGGDYDQSGGNGADSGSIFFNMGNIDNLGYFNIDLKTGNGGYGGYSSKDDSGDGYHNGGKGGNAGFIKIIPLNKIENFGEFLFTATGGDGGYGGVQRAETGTRCDKGHNGNGGNGGHISDVNISNLLNKESADFQLNLYNGQLGKVDTSPGNACKNVNDSLFGRPGKLGNINIDFLENNSNKLKINSTFKLIPEDYALALTAQNNHVGSNDSTNPTNLDELYNAAVNSLYYSIPGYGFYELISDSIDVVVDFFVADDPNYASDGEINGGNMPSLDQLQIKTTNININYLKNGSYLPSSINAKIDFGHPIFDNSLNISGCYIQPSNINYIINGGTSISATNTNSLTPYLAQSYIIPIYRYCPHCEVMDLTDAVNRYTRQYNIYSDINGTIAIGDLNIYYSNLDYSNNNTPGIYYTKRTDNKQKPVYTNTAPIIAVYDENVSTYKYPLNVEGIKFFGADPEDDREDLETDEFLFCYGQEYILKGKINTTSGSKTFEFPFVPLREWFDN